MVSGGDPRHKLARLRITRGNRCIPAKIFGCTNKRIETQAMLPTPMPIFWVWTMAADTAIGEDALDVAGKRGGLRRRSCG
jgi:hypothetical protein